MTARPVLYSFRRCPYALRARLALLASETLCEIREVKLSSKPAAMIAVSPKATVPVLVLPDASVIDESLDIMHWALDRHDPGGWLGGVDTALIAANDGAFKHDLDRYKYAGENRAEGVRHLHLLEERLATRRHLCGEATGFTDTALLPFVRQFAEVDRSWFDAQPLPAVQRWLAEGLASPLFETAMVRLPLWQPGDAPVFFGGKA